MIIASVEVHGRAKNTATIVFGILGALLLFTQLSGEYAQRNLQASVEKRLGANAEQIERSMQSLQELGMDEDGKIDPEKAGRAMGDFMRAMQEAAEGKTPEPATGSEEEHRPLYPSGAAVLTRGPHTLTTATARRASPTLSGRSAARPGACKGPP